MMPEPGMSTQPADPGHAQDDHRAELHRLRSDLERMTSYAQALEERCNRLWTYVPDTHGVSDPVLPFVARYCHITESGGSRSG